MWKSGVLYWREKTKFCPPKKYSDKDLEKYLGTVVTITWRAIYDRYGFGQATGVLQFHEAFLSGRRWGNEEPRYSVLTKPTVKKDFDGESHYLVHPSPEIVDKYLEPWGCFCANDVYSVKMKKEAEITLQK